MNLTEIETAELEQELERRKKHKFTIRGVEFQLTLDEVKELQAELAKINPPKNTFEEAFKKAVERQKDRENKNPPPYRTQPWIIPAPFDHPWKSPGLDYPNDFPQPYKIWC